MAEGNLIEQFAAKSLGPLYSYIRELWWLIALVLVAGIFFFWYRRHKKYPLKAIIWEQRGDDLITNTGDKLGRIKEDGIFKWKFKKSKDTLPPGDYSQVLKSAEATGIVHLIKYGASQYKCVDIKNLFRVYCADCLTECKEYGGENERAFYPSFRGNQDEVKSNQETNV